ncbi:hypothetical protein VPH35_122048 [Triticum aestivum]
MFNNINRSTAPLPDTGQWLLLALNERLPQTVVYLLRAHIITLHSYLMLFIMLGFSAFFDCIEGPGLGIGTRYMPWCAAARYKIPDHPHAWAQKYYVLYASDPRAIRRVILVDMPYASVQNYTDHYRPDWAHMSFLVDILRPSAGEGPSWYHLVNKAGGGCNDLIYSGHMFVAVLTAMAWTEAYGGWISGGIWFLVLHSAQREIRERYHYSADCIVAIYVGILLWRVTGFIWSTRDSDQARRLAKLDEVQNRLFHAAKDSDIDEIRGLLNEVEMAGQSKRTFSQGVILSFAAFMITFTLLFVLLAFSLTSNG